MESSQKKTFWQTIALFQAVGLLEYIVVVGSWAEYLYQEAGLIPGSGQVSAPKISMSCSNGMREQTAAIKTEEPPATQVILPLLGKHFGYWLAGNYPLRI